MKKPILVTFILLKQPLNALMLEAPTAHLILIQLIPSVDYSIKEKIPTAVPHKPKFSKFSRMSSRSPYVVT